MGCKDLTTLSQWLRKEPFTLTLSSGFFGFFAHIGLLSAFEQQAIFPNKITGSSAGALAGGLWASGVSAKALEHYCLTLRKNAFWDPFPGLGLLRGRKFRQQFKAVACCENIESCRIPLAISCFDFFRQRTQVFESGNLADCVYASCAVPLLFQPALIGKGLYFDGGIQDVPGIAGVQTHERVFYHHLISSKNRLEDDLSIINAEIPQRDNTSILIIHQLPAVSPNHLELGKIALEQTKDATLRVLEQPYSERIHVR